MIQREFFDSWAETGGELGVGARGVPHAGHSFPNCHFGGLSRLPTNSAYFSDPTLRSRCFFGDGTIDLSPNEGRASEDKKDIPAYFKCIHQPPLINKES